MQLVWNEQQIQEFLDESFAQCPARVKQVFPGGAVMEMQTGEGNLRPGGTISGPTLFTLADAVMYAAILAHLGPAALAVTTNCAIDFYRKPQPGRLRGEGRILKLGKRLVVGDVLMFSNDEEQSLAHASLTYSIPPDIVPDSEAGA